MKAKCAGCGRSGLARGGHGKPRWCKCVRSHGPIQAAPGTVVLFTYATPGHVADRERARAITNEWCHAREAGSSARWTDGGRRRSESSSIYRAWLARFVAAETALEQLQAACQHETRSFFSHAHCDRCALLIDEAA